MKVLGFCVGGRGWGWGGGDAAGVEVEVNFFISRLYTCNTLQ